MCLNSVSQTLQTEHRSCSGSKLFDTLIVFLKEFLKKKKNFNSSPPYSHCRTLTLVSGHVNYGITNLNVAYLMPIVAYYWSSLCENVDKLSKMEAISRKLRLFQRGYPKAYVFL